MRVVILLLFFQTGYSQLKIEFKQVMQLNSIHSILEYQVFYRDPSRRPSTITEALEITQSNPHNDPIVKKYKSKLPLLFSTIAEYPNHDETKFFIPSSINTPLNFFKEPDGGYIMQIGTLYTMVSLNDRIFSSSERAGAISKKVLIPFFKNLYGELGSTEIKKINLSILYLVKGLIHNPEKSEGEFISVTATIPSIKKLINLDITEDEFLSRLEVYQSTRQDVELKKIKIKLLE